LKLPFEFGLKLIFRLVLPGFLLTLGLYPTILALREKNGWTISAEYLLGFSVVITGWLVITLDQPIYMFLEGRRFWFSPLRTFFIWTEARRLNKLRHVEDKFNELALVAEGIAKQNFRQRYAEASVEKRRFPLDANGQPEARFPTRLGNLIYSYELYPSTRYGVNAIFHWYRIWLSLDKDLREELDNRQALADSSVYASVALSISGLLWAVYWVLAKLNYPIRHASTDYALLLALAFVILSYVMYRAALYPQAQYGESFKSVFDTFEKQINVTRVVERVAGITYSPEILNQDRRKQLQTTWRYLQNYTVKCPAPECALRYPMSPEEFEKHYCGHMGPSGVEPIVKSDLSTYRHNLTEAYKRERSINVLRSASVGWALLHLVASYYLGLSLPAVLVIVLSLILFWIEVWLRKKQEPFIEETSAFESNYEFPQMYKKPDSIYRKAAPLYGLMILAAIVVLIMR